MSARTYPCPGCGAAVVEWARRCEYCRAPVATVRCARCFHMNVPDALHCSGCGSEVGLEPLGDGGALSCPDCKATLRVFAGKVGALHDCDLCGGQFVEHGMLRELIEESERFATHLTEIRKAPPVESRVRYVPCPACSGLMNRKNFGGQSGVIVDICKKHGIWFDVGELPRVLAFVQSGGLEKERQRHLEEEAQARRAAALAEGNRSLLHDVNLHSEPAIHVGGLADLVYDLLMLP